jgi:hypothetical protein
MESGGKDAVAPRRSSRSRSAGGTSSGNDEQDAGSKSGTKSKTIRKQQGEQSLSDAEEHRGRAAARTVSFVDAEKEKTGVSTSVLHEAIGTLNSGKKKSEARDSVESPSTFGNLGQEQEQEQASLSKKIGDNLRGYLPLDLSWLMSPEGSRKPSPNEPTGSAKQSSNQVGGGAVADIGVYLLL